MLSLKTSWLSVKNGWSPYEIIHSGRHVHQTMNKGLAGMAGIYMYLYASPSLIAGWYLYVFMVLAASCLCVDLLQLILM
jgi:hypothetical protein